MSEIWIVCGGRHYKSRTQLEFVLIDLPEDLILRHGNCLTGVDDMVEHFWDEVMGRTTDPCPADWEGPCRSSCRPNHRRRRRNGSVYCPAAGNYRNQYMIDKGGVTKTLAFFGASGTHDMMQRSRVAKIPVETVGPGWDDLTIF